MAQLPTWQSCQSQFFTNININCLFQSKIFHFCALSFYRLHNVNEKWYWQKISITPVLVYVFILFQLVVFTVLNVQFFHFGDKQIVRQCILNRQCILDKNSYSMYPFVERRLEYLKIWSGMIAAVNRRMSSNDWGNGSCVRRHMKVWRGCSVERGSETKICQLLGNNIRQQTLANSSKLARVLIIYRMRIISKWAINKLILIQMHCTNAFTKNSTIYRRKSKFQRDDISQTEILRADKHTSHRATEGEWTTHWIVWWNDSREQTVRRRIFGIKRSTHHRNKLICLQHFEPKALVAWRRKALGSHAHIRPTYQRIIQWMKRDTIFKKKLNSMHLIR